MSKITFADLPADDQEVLEVLASPEINQPAPIYRIAQYMNDIDGGRGDQVKVACANLRAHGLVMTVHGKGQQVTPRGIRVWQKRGK